MNKTIGFIGAGNMGRAMIKGILNSGLAEPSQIVASAHTNETISSLSKELHIQTTLDNTLVAKRSDILFLAVKPHLYKAVIKEIRDLITDDKIIVAVAAGVTHSMLDTYFGKSVKIVRAMPNTPAMVSCAMSALSPNEHLTEEEVTLILSLFRSFGKAELIPENRMDTVIGVSGSSPAYVCLFIEAMADAAVADGMPRSQAYTFAAQSVLGTAKMILETGKHPAELKDAVCSPSGTTIEAVSVLEEKGFRNAVISAQRACVEKSRKMSEQN